MYGGTMPYHITMSRYCIDHSFVDTWGFVGIL